MENKRKPAKELYPLKDIVQIIIGMAIIIFIAIRFADFATFFAGI